MTSPSPLLTPPLNSVRKSAPKSASEKNHSRKIEVGTMYTLFQGSPILEGTRPRDL